MQGFIKKFNNKFLGIYIILLFFAAWELLPDLGVFNPQFIPPIHAIIQSGYEFGLGNILIHSLVSLKRIIIGVAVASAVALPLGFLLGGPVPKLEKFLKSLFTFLSNVPPFILSPIIIIIYGIGEGAIYFVIWWSAFWPILFTTIKGVQNINPMYIKASRSMGANNFFTFFNVILPGASSSILTGIGTGLTFSFMMLIGAESLGTQAGLGWLIHNSQNNGFVIRIYLAVFLVLVLGLGLNYLFEYLEKKLIVWKEDTTEKLV